MKRRQIYHGRIIDVDVEEVATPAGHHFELEVVRHPGGAATVALDELNRVCMLYQYRHVCGERLWELPAGKLEPGEPPQRTAERELLEEAGVKADTWRPLGDTVSSPGVFTEVVHLFLATDLHPQGQTDHELEETIEVEWIPLDQALNWCDSGQIRDAKTLIGLYRAQRLLQVAFEDALLR